MAFEAGDVTATSSTFLNSVAPVTNIYSNTDTDTNHTGMSILEVGSGIRLRYPDDPHATAAAGKCRDADEGEYHARTRAVTVEEVIEVGSWVINIQSSRVQLFIYQPNI